jgi:hypothetical protein
MDTVHPLSLQYSKQHLENSYSRFLSIQPRAAGYALTNLINILYVLSYCTTLSNI